MENEQKLSEVDATSLMIEDLAAQVARKSIEVAEWKARAIKAEAGLREAAETAELEADMEVVPEEADATE